MSDRVSVLVSDLYSTGRDEAGYIYVDVKLQESDSLKLATCRI